MVINQTNLIENASNYFTKLSIKRPHTVSNPIMNTCIDVAGKYGLFSIVCVRAPRREFE